MSLRKALFNSLYIILILGFVTFSYSSFFNLFFELFLVLLVVLNLGKITIHKRIFWFLVLNVFYVLLSILYSVYFKKDNILDFLLVYKIFFYLFLISFLVGKKFLSAQKYLGFFKVILFCFLFKYLTSILIFNNPRPIFFYENNYELMFLSLLFYLYYVIKGKVDFLYQVVLGLIFLLSGSRSGILILFFVLAVVNHKILVKRIFVIVPVFLTLIILAIYIFKQRAGGTFDIESIDRFRFFMVFYNEIKDWSVLDFLIGSERISELKEESCMKLAYYKSLFSYNNDGSCYSVILHSYLLRVIYDHGFLGLAYIITFIYKLVRASGYSYRNAIAILGIVIINGISVSSFNSIYFILGFVFFLFVKKEREEYILKN